jgi:large subunit ribosomal protein L15
MKIHQLSQPKGARKVAKRVGRGIGSGNGKTSGRGHKGQKSRSGGGVRRGFEGGQMPLMRRLPKRGFHNLFRKEYTIINIRDLDRFSEGEEVNPQTLKEKGIVKSLRDGIKVLGEGELKKKLTVCAHKFSKAAEEKIRSAAGEIKVL